MWSIDLQAIIQAIGHIGIFAIVFAESGLFFGFFFPGDSLLFTAGLLASKGLLNIYSLLFGSFVFAVLGDSVGYAFGAKVGPKIFTKDDSLLFQKKHIERTRIFYERYGYKTILLARFVPIVRTFAPILAGVGGMRYRTFLSYNIIGGFLWAVGVTSAGYWLSSIVPGIDQYLIPIVLFIILISVMPPILEWWRERKKSFTERPLHENKKNS